MPATSSPLPEFDRVIDTCYWNYETRPERAVFTRKLERLCLIADARPEVEVPGLVLYGVSYPPVALRLTSLSVAGSYARGAANCGDLDVIYDYEIVSGRPGHAPSESKLATVLFGSMQHVRLYRAWDDEKHRDPVSKDAIRVWDRPGCEWKKAIQSIRLRPDVTPYPRKIQSLPFRAEQLNFSRTHIDALEELVDARDKGLVTWEFIPFRSEHFAPLDLGTLSSEEAKVVRGMGRASKENQRLAPVLARLATFLYPERKAVVQGSDQLEFIYGTTRFMFGRVGVHLGDLSENLAIDRLVIAPSISTRGPNGAWVVQRGPAHPLSKLLSDLSVWILKDKEGAPLTLETSDRHGRDVAVLELFSNSEEAQESMFLDDEVPAAIDGHELMRHLARVHGTEATWIEDMVLNTDLSLGEPNGSEVPPGWLLLSNPAGPQGADLFPALLAETLELTNNRRFLARERERPSP